MVLQNTLPQRSGEVSATLGGIDLNNSGRYLSHSINTFSFMDVVRGISTISKYISCAVW